MNDEEIDCFGTYEKGHEECLICDEADECEKAVKLPNQKRTRLFSSIIFLFHRLGTSV